MKYCIGVDLGGTNIAAGVIELETRRIVVKGSVKTRAPRPCAEISQDIGDLCKDLASRAGVSMSELCWIGVATPGIVADGVVLSASNLKWENAPLGDLVASCTGVPVYVANDANVAAYAEAKWGSGEGASSLVAFTLGTGVGGGIVIGGKIWEGVNGFAAEMGHMIIRPGGRRCGCGNCGCLEAYSSATALVADSRLAAAEHPDSVMNKAVNGDVSRINAIIPFRAAEQGDPVAAEVIDTFISNLAIGIANIINVFQPEVVCIGGGISAEGEKLLAPLRNKVFEIAFGPEGSRTRIETAAFMNDAGIIGSALLGLQEGIL